MSTRKPEETIAEKVLKAMRKIKDPKTCTQRAITHAIKSTSDSVAPTLGRLIEGGYIERHEEKGILPYYTLTRKADSYEAMGAGHSSGSKLGFTEVFEGINPRRLRAYIDKLDQDHLTVLNRRLRATRPATLVELAESLGCSKPVVSRIQKQLIEELTALKG